jgi:hypothetical protein
MKLSAQQLQPFILFYDHKYMNKIYSLVVLLFMASAFVACEDDDLCLSGVGPVNDHVIEVANFTKVELSGPINLQISQGTEQEVNVRAQDDVFGPLKYSVQNGILSIGFDQNIDCLESSQGVEVLITVPNLEAVEVFGNSDVTSNGALDFPYLHVKVFGNANFELSGVIDEQHIECDGQIDVYNFDVESKKVTLNIDGNATVEITCTEELYIEVDGNADVHYKGTPVIQQDVSGNLNLVHVD